MNAPDTDAASGAEKRAGTLMRYAERHLPKSVATTRELDDWNVYAPATILRCIGMLRSIVILRDQPQDGRVVARCLFEHVITFAWIAADEGGQPFLAGVSREGRMRRWLAAEYRHREKADKAISRNEGAQYLTDATRKVRKDYLRGVLQAAPALEQMAREADQYWAPRLPGGNALKGRYSLSGLYALFYRMYSMVAHPTTRGLAELVHETAPGQVSFAPSTAPEKCVGAGTMMFGILLTIAARALGWSTQVDADLDDIFGHFDAD